MLNKSSKQELFNDCFPCGSAVKESACNVGDLSSVPGLGRFPWRRERLPTPVFWPGEFHGQYSSWGRRVGHDLATFTFHNSNGLFEIKVVLSIQAPGHIL